MAHLDGSGTQEAAMQMIHRVSELALGFPEGRLELQLIGGYADPRSYSEQLFYNILCKPPTTKCRVDYFFTLWREI